MPGEPRQRAAVVLAAGRSTRMGAENKLLLELEPGVPVIRRTVERASLSGLDPVYVVTGHEADRVRASLSGLECRFVQNPDYADGLSGSIRAGFHKAVGEGATGVIVLLGDMPFLPREAIGSVIDEVDNSTDRIVQAVHGGRPAHPVWLPACAAELVEALDGDHGVRSLLSDGEGMVAVEVGADAVLDLDTPRDFAAAKLRAANSGN